MDLSVHCDLGPGGTSSRQTAPCLGCAACAACAACLACLACLAGFCRHRRLTTGCTALSSGPQARHGLIQYTGKHECTMHRGRCDWHIGAHIAYAARPWAKAGRAVARKSRATARKRARR